MLHVAAEFAGTLIGKGGDTIKAISRDTGVRIEVSKDERDSDRTVSLCGSQEAIERASDAIEDVIRRARERQQGRVEAPAAAGEGDRRKVLQVSQDYVGMLIGKGGEKIKSMTRDSGARIEVSRDDGETERTVTMTGRPEAIEKATLLIEDVIKRARERFAQSESESEEEVLPTPPPGFEDCGQEGYLHHPARNAFFERTTGRVCWLDAVTGAYRDLHQGDTLELCFTASAATRLGCGGSSGTSGMTPSAASKQPAPKHVVIPDLHRAGQALKVTLDHLDRPSAMLGVFGLPAGTEGVPVEIAARGFHEKLIRRLAANRSEWPDEALFGAITGALFDLAAGYSGVQPVAAIALVVGRRVAAVSTAGTSLCLVTGSSVNSAVPSICVVAGGATTGFEELEAGGDSASQISIILSAGETQLDEGEMMLATTPHLYQGRPRAASVALLKAARQGGAQGQLAAACAHLQWPRTAPAEEPLGKQRGKAEDVLRKVRISQILLRNWQGKGAQPINPVRRKPVSRTTEDAEVELLNVLESLVADGCASFRSACKTVSECQSALKGGGLEGDLGWVDQAKDAALKRAKGEPGNPRSVVKAAIPAPVLKAAFELEAGDLSDLIHSDLGVHLVLRTA